MVSSVFRSFFSSTFGDDTKSDWTANAELIGNGAFYKDFVPEQDPDASTCCQKSYVTFGETVQIANEWLANQEDCEVINCECLLYSTKNDNVTVIPDSWPVSNHLRGLRVWVRKSTPIEEIPQQASTLKSRYLISYRDYSPVFDKKSMFNSKYDDANVLLERINSYLADRSTAARVISLQTLDTPMEGNLLDLDVDTEKSLLSFSQHGFTRYCRSFRLFSVTKYKRGSLAKIVQQPKIGFRDFAPNHSTAAGHELLSDVMKRALHWSAENQITLLNMQVLSLRASEHSTASSTWLLESPGHIPNKFTSFIRLAYIAPSDADDALLDKTTVEVIHQAEDPNKVSEESTNENEEEGESKGITRQDDSVPKDEAYTMPGMMSLSQKALKSTEALGLIHCKTFCPRLTRPGALCKKPEWETLEQTLERLNFWVSASQGSILTIYTQYVYSTGNELEYEDTRWARHMSGGRQIPVLQVVVVDGRPPTALPPHPIKSKSRCSIM